MSAHPRAQNVGVITLKAVGPNGCRRVWACQKMVANSAAPSADFEQRRAALRLADSQAWPSKTNKVGATLPDHDRAWRDVSSLPRPGSLRVAPPAGVILMLRLAAPINISTGAARHRRRVWLRSDGYARNGFFQSVWSLWLPSELNHPAPRRW